MTGGLTRHLARFFVSLLFTVGILVGGLATPVSASTAAQTSQAANTALSPNWGIHPGSQYVCCYTGKGEDVLFLHGVDGSSSGANGSGINGDCRANNNWGDSLSLLGDSNHQWVGNLITLGYYSGDHDCDASIRTSADAYRCNGYHDSVTGSNNEDDLHLACLLAWYIWDNYTVNTWTVNIVAHSLGGVLLKEALYKTGQATTGPTKNHDSHFPAYLFIDHAVTIASPLGGIPLSGAHFLCSCTEVSELEFPGGAIYNDLTSQDGRNASGLEGTTWLMEGQANGNLGCDHVGDSAFQMNYGVKVDYSYGLSGISGMQDACKNGTSWYYGHGTYLQDNQTVYNATVKYCSGCSGDPGTVTNNYPRSLTEMFWGLAGSCAASHNNNNCDGDDPNVTTCSGSETVPGGDPWYLTMYWSTGCSTNFALVDVPVSGTYLVKVTIASSPTRSWSNTDRHLIYCAPSRTTCPNDTWGTFGQFTSSWITDMLYAPTESVAVQIVTSSGATYTSIWH